MNNANNIPAIVSENDIVKTGAGRFKFENELFRAYIDKSGSQWRISITDRTKVMMHTTTYFNTATTAKKALAKTLNELPHSFVRNNAPARPEAI